MAKVLVIDPGRSMREFLGRTLSTAGYEVIEARDGRIGFEKATYEHPDIIMLEVEMPMTDGFEILKRLKENPDTESIPVIVLTTLSVIKGEAKAIRLGAAHYITKPPQPAMVEAVVKSALRSAEPEADVVMAGHEYDIPEPSKLIRSGYMPLDEKLGGGIPLGSLTMIQGEPGAGTSILCQHLAYEALVDGHGIAYFTSEYTGKSLYTQMAAFDRDTLSYFRKRKVDMRALEGSAPNWDPTRCENPDRLIALLAVEIEGLPEEYKVVILDPMTNLARLCEVRSIMNFFSYCKKLCGNDGRTIILRTHSYTFEPKVVSRVEDVCDGHFDLRAEEVGLKQVKMLRVRKAHNSVMSSGNMISFEVTPGIGMRNVPASRVRV